ncbi:hypothetical protein SNK05_013617 [Fusarium graminearum]
MGEFDLALEEIFNNGKVEQQPTWYRLKSKRPGKRQALSPEKSSSPLRLDQPIGHNTGNP